MIIITISIVGDKKAEFKMLKEERGIKRDRINLSKKL